MSNPELRKWKQEDPLDGLLDEIAAELLKTIPSSNSKSWKTILSQNLFTTCGSLELMSSEDFLALGIPLRVLVESRRRIVSPSSLPAKTLIGSGKRKKDSDSSTDMTSSISKSKLQSSLKKDRKKTSRQSLSKKSLEEMRGKFAGNLVIYSQSSQVLESFLSIIDLPHMSSSAGMHYQATSTQQTFLVNSNVFVNPSSPVTENCAVLLLFSFTDLQSFHSVVDFYMRSPLNELELPVFLLGIDKEKSIESGKKIVTTPKISEVLQSSNIIHAFTPQTHRELCHSFDEIISSVLRDQLFGSYIHEKINSAIEKKVNELSILKKNIYMFSNNVYQLKNTLQKIRLDSNNFKCFPTELCELSLLQEIALNMNSILDLPEEIANLKNLARLELEGNRIEILPINAIASLKSLVDLRLKGNPLTKHPKLKDEKVDILAIIRSQAKSSESKKSKGFISNRSAETLPEPDGAVFGVALASRLSSERKNHPERKLPLLTLEIVRHIIINALNLEGVFRVAGATTDMNLLQEKFDQGVVPSFKKQENPHNVTGLFKLYLRKLPECLFLSSNFEAITSLANENSAVQCTKIKELIDLLPQENADLLRLVFRVMYITGINAEASRMDFGNVSKVIAPNLLFKVETSMDPMAHLSSINSINDVIATAAQNYPLIFETNQDLFATDAFQENPQAVFYRRFFCHPRTLITLAMSDNQSVVWTGDSQGNVIIWDTDQCKKMSSFTVGKRGFATLVAVRDQMWAGTAEGIIIYKSTGEEIYRIDGIPAFTMGRVNDQVWVSLSKNQFSVFESTSFVQIEQKKFPDDESSFQPSNLLHVQNTLWFVSTDRRIRVVDLETGEITADFDSTHQGRVQSLNLCGRYVWTTGDDGLILVWDKAKHTLVKKQPAEIHDSKVCGVGSFSDQVWTYSRNGQIIVWDPETLEPVDILPIFSADTLGGIVAKWQPSMNAWFVFAAGWDKGFNVWLSKGSPPRLVIDQKVAGEEQNVCETYKDDDRFLPDEREEVSQDDAEERLLEFPVDEEAGVFLYGTTRKRRPPPPPRKID